MNRKYWSSIALVAATATMAGLTAWSAPITEDQAVAVADKWLNSGGIVSGFTAASARAVTAGDGVITHYIVTCKPKGIIFVAPDTRIEPILAFSGARGDDADNPLFGILRKDTIGRQQLLMTADRIRAEEAEQAESNLPGSITGIKLLRQLEELEADAQEKWAQILATPTSRNPFTDVRRSDRTRADLSAPEADVSDDTFFAPAGLNVWVEPLMSSSWGQEKQYGAYGDNLYNLMTPSNLLAGCGPVAVGQVLNYLEWPQIGASLTDSDLDYTLQKADGTWVTNSASLSGSYLSSGGWSTNIIDEYRGEDVSVAWTNVAQLLSDIGEASGASYGRDPKATGVTMNNLHYALTNSFNMPSAILASTDDNMAEILNYNTMGKKPVIMAFHTDGVDGSGHVAVVDGLAFTPQYTGFYHLNLGWGEVGENTAWYNLPTIIAYDTIDGYIYNVMTNGSELVVGKIASGGSDVEDAVVTINGDAATGSSDAYGVFGLSVDSASACTVVVSKVGFVTQTNVVTTGTSSGNDTGNEYLSVELVAGDDVTFTAGTYGSNVVLQWSDPTDSFYPASLFIVGTTNASGAETDYESYWSSPTNGTSWYTNFTGGVVTGGIASVTNTVWVGDGSANTSITLTNMNLDITYYFKMWATNDDGFVEIENGTSTASCTPDSGNEVVYFKNTSTGKGVFKMPKKGRQTSGTYLWKYEGVCSTNDMSNYSIVASADFNTNSVADIVWERSTVSTNGDTYVLWLMNENGELNTATNMDIPFLSYPVVDAEDMDADGLPDLITKSATSGEMFIYYLADGVYTNYSTVLGLPAANLEFGAFAEQ